MLFSQLALLLLLLPVCSFAPGFFVIRKLRWNPPEKLCGSVGLSLILLYLAAWGIYCAGARGDGLPPERLPFFAVSLVCLAMGAVCWKDMAVLWRAKAVREALAGFGFLLLWTGIVTAVIRNFSGALWFGDWLEHFQRSLFFLRHFPANVEIFPGYVLPARPPMMNVLTAFFLGQTADRFEIFQAVFLFLNVLLFLPCYLLMPALGRKARRRTWPLVLLFVSSPLVMQNSTYTWTKAAAAFYVVLAIWFYLAGWRKGDSVRIVAAFIALAAGLLEHYSAGPYIVIVTLHYLIGVWPRRPNRWRELAWITVLCGVVAGSWLVWSMAVYSPHTTFTSNSSVTLSQKYGGGWFEKYSLNLYDTIVPLVIREPNQLTKFDAQRQSGAIRDWFFIFYQVNAIFAMGLVGGPLVVWLTFRALRRQRKLAPARAKRPVRKAAGTSFPATPEQIFWRILIAAGVVLGVAVVGEQDVSGVGHLTLLSLQVIGLAMIAAVLPWRRNALTVIVLAGCVVDFSFGVLLHAHIEGLDNSAGFNVFPGAEFVAGQIQVAAPGPDALSSSAWGNWRSKHKLVAYDEWLNDLSSKYANDPAFQSLLPAFHAQIDKAREDDATNWQGWFARHGGEVTFLGDHLTALSGVLQVALLMLFLGLAGSVYWRTS